MEPVIIHSAHPGRIYRMALVFIVIGCIPFIFFAFGEDDRSGRIGPGTAALAGVLCIGYGLAVAANTFLRYPLLRIEPNRLTLARTPLTQKVVDNLGELGPVYVVQRKAKGFVHTDLVFRLAADEAARAAKTGAASPPETDDVAERLPIDRLTGNDMAVAQALVATINSHRGFREG